MSYSEFMLIWLMVHITMGLLCAYGANRWGRSSYAWFLIGSVLGALALLILAALHLDDRRNGRIGSP